MDEDLAMGATAPGLVVSGPTHNGHLAIVDDQRRTSCSELTDTDLVAAIVLHRGEAYAELYRRHSKSVTGATRMILGNSPAIEDVVAEVFVSFWMAPEKFDAARGSLLAFLRLKAKGRSIDMVRSESARRRRETGERAMTIDEVEDCDQEMLQSERAVFVHHAVSLLPAIEREAICLAYFDGMTYTAVADHLKLPEGTVKSRIRSGLRRLALSDEVKLQHLSCDGEGNVQSDTPSTHGGTTDRRPT
jgi:RNA polymerase sigma-70 factor (ECF subfamily)